MKRYGKQASIHTEVYLAYTKREGKQGQYPHGGITQLHEEREKTRTVYTRRYTQPTRREGKQGQYMQGGILILHEKRGKQGQCKQPRRRERENKDSVRKKVYSTYMKKEEKQGHMEVYSAT